MATESKDAKNLFESVGLQYKKNVWINCFPSSDLKFIQQIKISKTLRTGSSGSRHTYEVHSSNLSTIQKTTNNDGILPQPQPPLNLSKIKPENLACIGLKSNFSLPEYVSYVGTQPRIIKPIRKSSSNWIYKISQVFDPYFSAKSKHTSAIVYFAALS